MESKETSTLNKISATHVVKLCFAPNSKATHAIQLGFAPIVYPPNQYK
jgi:hypothetical protein